MRSPTQVQLSESHVADYVRASFGPRVRPATCRELTGGGYAAVWRVSLNDGGEVVLKVAPPPHVRQLRYERDLLTAEARYFELLKNRDEAFPVPNVRHLDPDGRWLFTSLLPGVALPDLPSQIEVSPVRRQLGTVLARVHRITGDKFGYWGDRPHGTHWRTVFSEMMDDLLLDAQTWRVALPVPQQEIRDAITFCAAELDEVTVPRLVHFDLWDGNLLATPDGALLTGLVDGERCLFGDPLIDFVSPAILRRIEEEPAHPMLLGYGRSVVFGESERRRLSLYRLHLYLLMLVEMPSRGMVGERADLRRTTIEGLLRRELAYLRG